VRKDSSSENPITLNTIGIDDGYIDVLGIHLLAGRNFSKSYATDDDGLIITESAAKQFGYKKPQEAIGKQLVHDNVTFSIVGVVEDFHHQSLEKKAEPIVFQFNGTDYEADEYYIVKLKGTNLRQTIDDIQSKWNEAFNRNPFGFFFMDEFFNKQYQSDIQFGELFGTFSIIAIVIACVGLFALVAFMVHQRTKEIGIRKVLGASIRDIMFLLTKDFARLVLLANIIAWPLAWLLMNNWLKDFAYRININLWVFILAGFVTLISALITISFRSIKAALVNPVSSLRME
jgi:putative ABC transport system permease protein